MSLPTTFTVKAIILARALAEMTVLAILGALPFVLLLAGKFTVIHPILRWGICLMSPLALLALWGFGRVCYRVVLEEGGLTARSLLKKQFLRWEQIRLLKQINRIGWREFLLVHENGEVGFPCLLHRCSELVETIRLRLPGRGRSITGDAQSYKVVAATTVRDCGKLLLQTVFAGLFFCFYESLRSGGKAAREDQFIVLGAAILISAFVAFKLIQLLRLPREVLLTKEGMTFKHLFGASHLAWSEITKVAESGLPFPEGLLIYAGSKKCLIADTFDCFDELAEEIRQRSSLYENKKD